VKTRSDCGPSKMSRMTADICEYMSMCKVDYSHSLRYSLTDSLTPPTLTQILTRTHTHTHSPTLTHTLTHTPSPTLPPQTLTYIHPPSPTQSHTHSLTHLATTRRHELPHHMTPVSTLLKLHTRHNRILLQHCTTLHTHTMT
jgi:hypothetical protein